MLKAKSKTHAKSRKVGQVGERRFIRHARSVLSFFGLILQSGKFGGTNRISFLKVTFLHDVFTIELIRTVNMLRL